MSCEALLFCNIYSILSTWKVEMNKAHVGLQGLSVMLCPIGKKKPWWEPRCWVWKYLRRINEGCFCLKGLMKFLHTSIFKLVLRTGKFRKGPNVKSRDVGNTTIFSFVHFLPVLKAFPTCYFFKNSQQCWSRWVLFFIDEEVCEELNW